MLARTRSKVTMAALSVLLMVAAQLLGARPAAASDLAHDYAQTIGNLIRSRWIADPASREMPIGSRCEARIRQLPGGRVFGVEFLPDCDFSERGRTALATSIEAVGALPYKGFESVFQRDIRLTFHAASAEEREQYAAASAANLRQQQARDMELAKRPAILLARDRMDAYVLPCGRHIGQALPAAGYSRPSFIAVRVAADGKPLDVTFLAYISATGQMIHTKRIDKKLVAALARVPSCPPVPANVPVPAGGLEIEASIDHPDNIQRVDPAGDPG